MKSLYILYTGGTIGMTPTPQGLQPSRDLAATALQPYTGSLKLTWHICDPLIDSSALAPTDWANWLALLHTAIAQHDAILILHGTDTLAYTANLLALALNPQGKPIILTAPMYTAYCSPSTANSSPPSAAAKPPPNTTTASPTPTSAHGKLKIGSLKPPPPPITAA